jgi:hemolysin activation/secretion protein
LQIYKVFLTISFLLITGTALSYDGSDTIQITEVILHPNDLKTKSGIVLRELSFRTTQIMTVEDLIEFHIPRSISNLKNLNLFNQINITPEFVDGNAIITITLIEKWYLWPIPYIEFADRNFNQWSTFDFDPTRTNIGLYVFKYNLFGLNHTIKATFGSGYTKTLGFEYRAPYIDNSKKLGFMLDVRRKSNQEIRYGLINNKEQFYRSESADVIKETSAFAKLIFRPGLYVRHSLSANFNDIEIDDTVVTEELNTSFLFDSLTKQRLTTVAYNISFDNRDNKLFPLTGVYANVGMAYTAGAQEFLSVGFDLNFYRPLPLNRMFSRISYTYGDAIDQNLPYNLNQAIGVEQNVRGYEQYVFLGDQYAILRAELRYLIIPERDIFLRYMPVKSYKKMPIESYLSAFYDQAQVINNGFQTELYGFGIGVNTLIYYDKVFRFEYSWNHWNRSGLKVHFKKAF